jgi:hypothetical protein
VSLLLGKLGATHRDPQRSVSWLGLASRRCAGCSLINGAVAMPGRSRSMLGDGKPSWCRGAVNRGSLIALAWSRTNILHRRC